MFSSSSYLLETLILQQCTKTSYCTKKYLKWSHSVSTLNLLLIMNLQINLFLLGVLTDVKSYYNLSDSDAGLLQTSFIISYMIMAPLFGYLGDRYNRRYIMAGGILFWSATTFLGSCIPAGVRNTLFIWKWIINRNCVVLLQCYQPSKSMAPQFLFSDTFFIF